MSTVSIQEIERDPASFIRRLEAGEELLITRDQQPLADVRPLAVPARAPRPFGLARGQFTVPDDFDEPLPESVLLEFEGGRSA